MPIDGFTIVAQMVNFLVLVLLLKRFLYGPVMRAMDQREARIAKRVADSEKAQQEARQRADDLAEQQQAFLNDKAKLLAEARTQIEQWREEKIERLRREIDALRRSWLEQVDHDRQAFLLKLKSDAVRHVMRMGDKVIRDLADQQMEAHIISVFMEKTGAENKAFRSDTYAGSVRLISGFELSDDVQARVRDTCTQWFPSAQPVEFEVSGELGMGVEVLAGDRKVAWNLEKYLQELEKEMLRVLPSTTRNAA